MARGIDRLNQPRMTLGQKLWQIHWLFVLLPSTWCEAEAVPQRKPGGKGRIVGAVVIGVSQVTGIED